MIQLNEIPHLKLYRQITALPFNTKDSRKGSLIINNSRSVDSITDLMNVTRIQSRNKFLQVYIDKEIVRPINGKVVRVNLKEAGRENVYKKIRSKNSNLKGVNQAQLSKGLNTIYDISNVNDMYFINTNKLPILKRTEGYMEFVMRFIDDKFEAFNIKTMLINVDEWTHDIRLMLQDKKSIMNPIYSIYFHMYKNIESFTKLGNINIIFYTNSGQTLRLNPELCKSDMNKSFTQFRTELFKFSLSQVTTLDEDKILEEDNAKREMVKKVMNSYTFGLNGDIDPEIRDEIESKIEDAISNTDDEDEAKALVEEDANLIKSIYLMSLEKTSGKTSFSNKRDEELRKRQLEVKLENMSLQDIVSEETSKAKIETNDIKDKVFTSNENVTKVRYPNIDKVYNDKIAEKDFVNIILGLNEKEIPIYVRKITKEDSSDLLNYKDTYRLELEDVNRVRHTITFDVPKFIDDKFLYIGGNRQTIIRQQMIIPIAKTGPDTVQTCSNYNKIFVTRYGFKLSSEIEKFKKAINKSISGVNVTAGSYLHANKDYITSLDYDELSKHFKEIKVDKTIIILDQKELRSKLAEKKVKLSDETLLPLGFNGPDILFFDMMTQTVVETDTSGKRKNETEMSVVEYICSKHEVLSKEVTSSSSGKKYMYTRAKIMNKNVSLALLLSYFEGLSGFLKRAGIRHQFTDTKPRVGANEGIVQFSNGYLVYDKNPLKNSLLMNAFADIPTKAFEYEDFDTKEVYLSLFEVMFKRRNIAIAFDNFKDNFVDPITLEVLKDLNLPTDITGILLYANELLQDSQYTRENDLSLYRIRSNEIVNALVFKEITKAYENYKITSLNNNPKKMAIPRDSIIKELQKLPITEDYSTLNPIVELSKGRSCTPKGPNGANVREAYNLEKRSYDESMLGVFSLSTSPDGNCGIVRELTLNPAIISPRGYVDIKSIAGAEGINDAQLFSPVELLSPLGNTRDDPTRTAMATKQSKHIVPVKNSSPVLISNGVEQVIQYHLSKDFAVVAKEDGEVVEIDSNTGLIVIKYKSGLTEAFETNPKVVKNGAGGFYLSNQLQTKVKLGQKFKKDDILATDKHFFTDSKISGNRFNIGSFQKVAVMSSYATYEDSSFITKKLSRDMASEVLMDKAVTLGKNTTVEYMAKIGDKVKVGDELIRFEKSFNEDALNSLLANIGEELQEEIRKTGKEQVKTKYSGVIEDIKIYSTVDLEDLSPSLRKIVSDYYTKINKRKKVLDKHATENNELVKCGVLFNEPSSKVEAKNNKIRGHQVGEGVLIEFYIKYYDEMGVGDKLAFFTALKSIVGETIEEGQEPYALSRPDEEISSVIAPAAIIARGTPSILLTIFTNKIIVETKRKLKEIYDSE